MAARVDHAASMARMRVVEEAAAKRHAAAERRRRLRDAAYHKALGKNPEGNNRDKGNAPIGRVSVARNRQQHHNHSSGAAQRPRGV